MSKSSKPSGFIQYVRKKSRLQERLQQDGRWKAFMDKKKEIKKQGFPDAICWIGAALHFPPTDGSDPEFTQRDYEERVGLLQDAGTAAALRVQQFNAQAGVQAPVNAAGNNVIDVQAIQLRLAEENAKKAEHYKREQAWENLRREVAKYEGRKGYKRATVTQQTLWALENDGTPPQEIDASTVPGRGALRLLRSMSMDSDFYKDIAKTAISKFATKEDTENLGHADDGRKQLEVMSQLDDIDTDLLDEGELAEYLKDRNMAEEEREYEDEQAMYGVGEGDPDPEPEVTIDPPAEEGDADVADPQA